MRIDFDRISKLAGLTPGSNRRGLYEGADKEPDNEEDMWTKMHYDNEIHGRRC